MYTLVTEDNHKSKKARSINKNVVNDEDCKNVLINISYIRHEMNRIQSKDHNIRSYRISKISLSSYNEQNIIKHGYILGCHIFINLHIIDHIRLILSNIDNLFIFLL